MSQETNHITYTLSVPLSLSLTLLSSCLIHFYNNFDQRIPTYIKCSFELFKYRTEVVNMLVRQFGMTFVIDRTLAKDVIELTDGINTVACTVDDFS